MEDISVVMPVYNGAGTYLDAAIDSILTQRDVDLKLYVCDDGSTDATWRQLQDWKSRDSRIVCLRNDQNQKAAAARNRCLSVAEGKYIALMDADDISHPERLKKQKAFLESRPELAFTGTRGLFFKNRPGDMDRAYWFVKQPKKKDFLMTLPFVHASLMLRHDVLYRTNGYSEDVKIVRSEDYELLMRLYANGQEGENIDEPLYYIRMVKDTYLRRKYRYRVNESYVKWKGFAEMGLMPGAIPYAVKPLAVGLIPAQLLEKMKRLYYKDC